MEYRIDKKIIEDLNATKHLKFMKGDLLKFDISERIDHKFEDFFNWLKLNYTFRTHISNGCINGYPDFEITGPSHSHMPG